MLVQRRRPRKEERPVVVAADIRLDAFEIVLRREFRADPAVDGVRGIRRVVRGEFRRRIDQIADRGEGGEQSGAAAGNRAVDRVVHPMIGSGEAVDGREEIGLRNGREVPAVVDDLADLRDFADGRRGVVRLVDTTLEGIEPLVIPEVVDDAADHGVDVVVPLALLDFGPERRGFGDRAVHTSETEDAEVGADFGCAVHRELDRERVCVPLPPALEFATRPVGQSEDAVLEAMVGYVGVEEVFEPGRIEDRAARIRHSEQIAAIGRNANVLRRALVDETPENLVGGEQMERGIRDAKELRDGMGEPLRDAVLRAAVFDGAKVVPPGGGVGVPTGTEGGERDDIPIQAPLDVADGVFHFRDGCQHNSLLRVLFSESVYGDSPHIAPSVCTYKVGREPSPEYILRGGSTGLRRSKIDGSCVVFMVVLLCFQSLRRGI